MASFNEKVSGASGVVGLVTGVAMLAPQIVKGGAWLVGKVQGKKKPKAAPAPTAADPASTAPTADPPPSPNPPHTADP